LVSAWRAHRHQEFIRFLNRIEAAVPAGKLVHAVLDNYAAHKHPKVRAWLARHPRWMFHFTPTSCFRANAVETFFATLGEHNQKPKPVVWTADPNHIIEKIK
jgi:transposase